MDNLIQSALGKIKDRANNLFGQAGQAVNNSVVSLGQSPVGQGLVNAQNFIQSPQPINPLPQVQPFQGNNIASKVGNFATNLPFAFGNSLASPILNIGSDLSQTIGRSINGQGAVPYQNLKSNVSRLEYNAGGVNNTPQQILGNVAGVGADAMNYLLPARVGGAVKAGLEQAGKEGLLQAAGRSAVGAGKFMAAQGGLQGLSEGRNAQDIPSQLIQGGQGAVQGGVTGLALGGVIGGGSHITGLIQDAFPKASPEVQKQVGQAYARDVQTGKFKAANDSGNGLQGVQDWVRQKVGKKPGEPVYASDLKAALQEGKINFNAEIGTPSEKIEQSSLPLQPNKIQSNPLANEQTTETLPGIVNRNEGLPSSSGRLLETKPIQDQKLPTRQVKYSSNQTLSQPDPKGQTQFSQTGTVPTSQAMKFKVKGGMPTAQSIDKEMNQPFKGNPEPLPWETNQKQGLEYGNNKQSNILEQREGQSSNRLATTSRPSIEDYKIADKTLPPKTNLQDRIGSTASDNIVRNSGYDVKTKVGLHDYFRTPDRVLQKIGLGKEADQLRTSYSKYEKELPVEINKITEWSKQVPPEGNQKIFKYLDGQQVQLNPNEQRVATEVKSYLKEWADKLKLPEDNRITNYITHIFDKELVGKEFDPELAKLIRDKIPGSVYDPFTEQRLGARGYKEDTWQALDAYVKRGVRKYNLDPALEKIAGKAENMEDSQFKYVKQFIDRVNMRPTFVDNAIDNSIKQVIGYKLGQRPVTAITRGLRQMGYRGTLGYNIGSALKNLSQGSNTYAKLGEKFTTIGYVKTLTQGVGELEKEGILGNDMVQDRTINATKKFWENTDKRLFYFFETAEKINRGAAYFGAKAKGLSQGMDEASAIEFAKKTVRDTQFTFGSIDTPAVLQSDLAKTLGQFQSYNLKQTEFLAEMIKNKEYAGLARYAASSLAFAYGVGQLIGAKPTDLIPFWNVATGQTKIGDTPAIAAVGKLKDAAFGGTDQYGKPLTPQARVGKAIDAFTPLVPGGVQAKKTIQGLTAVAQGQSDSATGKMQYAIPQDPVTAARAAIFGKANLPQAQDYKSNNRTPLSDKQTQIFKSLSPEEQQAYVDSVYKGRANSSLMNQIKKGIEQGKNVDDLIKKAGASSTTPSNALQLKAKEDIAKSKVKLSGNAVVVGDKFIYYQNGATKTIDLSPKTTGQGIDAFVNQNDKFSKARAIFGSTMPDNLKQQAYQQLGITQVQAEYDYKAAHPDNIKTQYIAAKAPTESHDMLMQDLINGRVKSVSGQVFASNGVVNSLAQQGIISLQEAKYLNSVQYSTSGQNIGTSARGVGVGKAFNGAARIKSQMRSAITRQHHYKVKKAPPPKRMKVKVSQPKLTQVRLSTVKAKPTGIQLPT